MAMWVFEAVFFQILEGLSIATCQYYAEIGMYLSMQMLSDALSVCILVLTWKQIFFWFPKKHINKTFGLLTNFSFLAVFTPFKFDTQRDIPMPWQYWLLSVSLFCMTIFDYYFFVMIPLQKNIILLEPGRGSLQILYDTQMTARKSENVFVSPTNNSRLNLSNDTDNFVSFTTSQEG